MSDKINIDITTTATLRPQLLDRTYNSFKKKLFKDKHNYRAIINIDPIGSKCTAKEVVNVAKKYFKTVIYNVPREPSFPNAWKWTWMQVEADYVFHLEEDWLLTREVDIDHMLKIMRTYKTIAALRMAKMDIRNLFFFSSKYKQKDGFLLAMNKKKSFGGNPQLIKGDFVKATRDLMISERNPEKQFRAGNPVMFEILMAWDYAVYGKLGDRMLVEDIGRTWRRRNRFEKEGGAGFLKWKKI